MEREAEQTEFADNDRLSISEQVALSGARSGPEFDPVVLGLTLRFYKAMAAFERAHVAELSPHRLTVGQFNVLNVLDRAQKPLTMRELSLAVAVRPTQLTGVVDSLCQRGLVQRDLNPSDRRSFLASISESGRQFLQEFLPGHWFYLRRLTSLMTPDERAQLDHLLQRLLESVEAADQAPPELIVGTPEEAR